MSRRIVAIRHGKPLSEGFAEDALRPLSEEGLEITSGTVATLKAKGYTPTRLLSSPLLRALQTAEVVAEAFDQPVEVERALGIDFDGERLLSIVAAAEEGATLYLVGHAPTLGAFINELAIGEPLPGGLSKSEAAIIEFPAEVGRGAAQLIERVTPSLGYDE